ncbi:MAG TPA: DNA methyltransferase [Bacillota bacterium]|nr:DNA methyltransferase [Bacillota bacterium]
MPRSSVSDPLLDYLRRFESQGRKTRVEIVEIDGYALPFFINEFWTSRQRQASSIHEISYRACFKPQLPRFFIELCTEAGDAVYDPFGGRGTTAIEAALLGRCPVSNDVNPLSAILTRPRLKPPRLDLLEERLNNLPLDRSLRAEMDLSMFYHPATEGEIVSLKRYLEARAGEGREDDLDSWIRMVATNRLTGHSSGFFSVYTLPPNQAVSPERQMRINRLRRQVPEYRDTCALILKKSRSLLRNLAPFQRQNLNQAAEKGRFLCADARSTPELPSGSIRLTVTSPPFLDVVQYSRDNWLRCWFNGIDPEAVAARITMARTVEEWRAVMAEVFRELYRVTGPGGRVAFEVGEVRKGTIRLEEHVVPLGLQAGFHCPGVLINTQEFTKTANIWGISNNRRGTNTNRIVLFQKP